MTTSRAHHVAPPHSPKSWLTASIVCISLMATTIMVAVAAPTAQVAEAAPAPGVESLKPARLLDTRFWYTTIDARFEALGQRGRNSTIEVQIAGRGGVPRDATAAILNVTAVQPSDGTVITVFPCGTRPEASNLNVPAHEIRANSVFAKLSGRGSVCVYTAAATDIVIDVGGYVPAGGTPTSVAPARLLETRSGNSTIDGKFNNIGQRRAASTTEVQIAGRAGVPNDATAALLNVTAVQPSEGTLVTVFPCGTRPEASNLNLPVGDIRANSVFAQLSARGTVCVYTVAATDLVIDLNGFVPAASAPTSMAPARLLETRSGLPTIDGQFRGIGKRSKESTSEIKIAGRAGIPNDATAAVLNVTVVQPAEGTFVTVFPCGARPQASTLNVPAGGIAANAAVVKLSPRGTVCVFTVAATDIVIDVNGYVPAPSSLPRDCVVAGTAVASQLPAIECEALVALYQRGGGNGWTNKAGWMSRTDPCTWYGVSCTAGHVYEVDLYKANVTQLPPEIGNLSELLYLDVAGSKRGMVGLPPEIGNLSKLTVLLANVRQGLLAEVSQIPPEIGNLRNLTVLGLANPRDLDTGLLIMAPEMGQLTNLIYLDLTGNQLGSKMPSIDTLTKLRYLQVDYNRFSELPPGTTKLTELIYLSVEGTGLTNLPSNLGDLHNLRFLSVARNEITKIPASLERLTKLEYLILEHNKVGSAIPPQISRLTNLGYLDLNTNHLYTDATSVFRPLMAANRLWYLDTRFNACVATYDDELAYWLYFVDQRAPYPVKCTDGVIIPRGQSASETAECDRPGDTSTCGTLPESVDGADPQIVDGDRAAANPFDPTAAEANGDDDRAGGGRVGLAWLREKLVDCDDRCQLAGVID